jgi:hypothetical protein
LERPPPYLANRKGFMTGHDFADTEVEVTHIEIHSYVTRRYSLLDHVVRARKVHHSHVYAIDNLQP